MKEVLIGKANTICLLIRGEIKSIDYDKKTAVIENKYGERKVLL